MADMLAGLGVAGAMILLLLTLPATLPVALLLGWNDGRRLRAAAVAYLASDDAAFVTGAALAVDGGRLGRL